MAPSSPPFTSSVHRVGHSAPARGASRAATAAPASAVPPGPGEVQPRGGVAEEDRGVFLLALALGVGDPCSGRAAVVCVRANADAAGPVYGCSLVVDCLPRALRVSETSVVPSYSAPGEFDVDAPCVSACQFSLQGEETKELRLRVRVHLQDIGYRGIPVRFVAEI